MPEKKEVSKKIELKADGKKFAVNVTKLKSKIEVQFQINNASCSAMLDKDYDKFDKKAALKHVQDQVATRVKQMKVNPGQITD